MLQIWKQVLVITHSRFHTLSTPCARPKNMQTNMREANGGQNLLWQNHLSRFLAFVTYPPVSTISTWFTFWSGRRVEIGMATSGLQAVGRLRLPLWGAAHQNSQFGQAKVLVKVEHSCGCESCGQVTDFSQFTHFSRFDSGCFLCCLL